MASILKWYNQKLAQHPVITNSVSAAVLFGGGDILAQTAVPDSENIGTIEKLEEGLTGEKKTRSIDWTRTARAAVYGGMVFAPLASKFWYPFLQRVQGSTPRRTALKRMAFDQLGFAPLVGIPLYFTCLGIMENRSSTEIKEHVANNYQPTLLANWSVWPAFQYVNFRYMPADYRLLTVNTISIAWNTFLSVMNSRN